MGVGANECLRKGCVTEGDSKALVGSNLLVDLPRAFSAEPFARFGVGAMFSVSRSSKTVVGARRRLWEALRVGVSAITW